MPTPSGSLKPKLRSTGPRLPGFWLSAPFASTAIPMRLTLAETGPSASPPVTARTVSTLPLDPAPISM